MASHHHRTPSSDSSDSDYDDDMHNQQQHDSDWEDWDAAAGGAGAEGEDEEENDSTRSLFDASVLPSPVAALEYDAATHGFDLRQYRQQACLDDYGTIQVINFIRRQVAAGADPLPALAQAAAAAAGAGGSASTPPWSSEDYLTPVLPDDPLLTYDYDDEEEDDEGGVNTQPPQHQQQGGVASSATTASGSSDKQQQQQSSSSVSGAEVAALKAQLAAARSDNQQLLLRVAALMEVALPADVQRELREAAAEDGGGDGARLRGPGAASSSSSSGGVKTAAPAAATSGVVGVRGRVDAAYYDSYSYFDIHHEMLSDKPRTLAYRSALTSNPSLIKGATVLDVGCGTSILSLFAARGGASAVVGLDGSERIAGFARQIVAANGLDAASGSGSSGGGSSVGGPVTIISGKVEEVDDIGHDKVSVIVSEWMGYALLFESMLDSLLAARDKWLRPGGAVLPDRASVWVAGADSGAFGCSFWKDVYGFNMAPVACELASSAASEAKVLVRPVEQGCIVTDSMQVHDMDLATMTADQQDFTATFTLTPQQAAAAAAAGSTTGVVTVSALVLWFDVEFSERFCKECPVTLSTSPSAAPTHWAQAVLPLATPIQLAAAVGSDSSSSSSLQCRLSMARSRSKHRCLDISLEVTPVGAVSGCASAAKANSTQARVYSMEVTGTD